LLVRKAQGLEVAQADRFVTLLVFTEDKISKLGLHIETPTEIQVNKVVY
jgi:hypothetical protein